MTQLGGFPASNTGDLKPDNILLQTSPVGVVAKVCIMDGFPLVLRCTQCALSVHHEASKSPALTKYVVQIMRPVVLCV
jgi:hypothetical protein